MPCLRKQIYFVTNNLLSRAAIQNTAIKYSNLKDILLQSLIVKMRKEYAFNLTIN